MTFYQILLTIHVFSAILGIGPGFAMMAVVKKATNITELRYGYAIRTVLHICVMVGGTLLLLTGLTMGFMQTHLFHKGWYISSLILFLIALGFGPLVLSPRSKPIKALLKDYAEEKIPDQYYVLERRLFFCERIENGILTIIIFLMVLKPF